MSTPGTSPRQPSARSQYVRQVQLLTTKEAAERIRIEPRTLRSWQPQGLGPTAIRTGAPGSALRYREVEVDRFIALVASGLTYVEATVQLGREKENI